MAEANADAPRATNQALAQERGDKLRDRLLAEENEQLRQVARPQAVSMTDSSGAQTSHREPFVTTDQVSMVEALERLLPHCGSNPYKVASRLDQQHRDGDVRLLGNGVVMAPGANPRMLGVKAHILPDGRAVLYVQVRMGLHGGDYPVWDGETVTGETEGSLTKHHKFWMFERKSFDDHLPDTPISDKSVPDTPVHNEPISREPVPDESKTSRGGRPADYSVEELLADALVYVSLKDMPKTMGGGGGLHAQLTMRLGNRCPGLTRFKEIFRPIFEQIHRERPLRHADEIAEAAKDAE
jgi:hypothetical protein